jgi:hypothetical protein
MSSRPKTVQAHDRLFSRVLHGRLATEQDAKPDSFAAHVSAPAAPGAVQAISSPPENYAFHMEAAAQKNMYPLPKLVILGLLAGAYISMGYSLCSLVGGQLSKEFRMEQPGAFNFLFGIFGFPMGLTLCVVAGADLFTSNCMYATIAVAEGGWACSPLVATCCQLLHAGAHAACSTIAVAEGEATSGCCGNSLLLMAPCCPQVQRLLSGSSSALLLPTPLTTPTPAPAARRAVWRAGPAALLAGLLLLQLAGLADHGGTHDGRRSLLRHPQRLCD